MIMAQQSSSTGCALHKLVLVIAVTAVAGCAVGPDYQRPTLDVPATFRVAETAAANAAAGTVLGDLAWTAVFRDPVLQELIRTGLANNADLQVAAARVEEYRARAGVAHSALLPQVSAGVGYSAQNGSRLSDPALNASNDTVRNWDAGVQLSWELDLFGRLRREDEAALARWLASEQGRRSVVVSLVADIAAAYFTLQQYDLELEIAQRTLASNTQQVEFYRTRLDGGASNRLELDQAVANRAQTAARIPDFERQIAQQENRINFLLGRNPGPVLRGQPLTAQHLPPAVPVGLPLQLLERRPDVQEAEQQLAAANADIGAAKALFFPSISITGMTGGLSRDFNDLGDSDAAVWSAGAGLLQPLFHAGAIRFNYRAAQARFDQALAQYRGAVQNSFRETADAIVAIEKTRAMRTEIDKAVLALRDATDLARARYEGGLSSYLDILIADQNLFAAELQLAELRGAEFTTTVNLYRALGGGWQPSATDGTTGISAPATGSQQYPVAK